MKTKICIECGIEKNLNEFYFRKDTNKYRNKCKECTKKIIYTNRIKNYEKFKKIKKKSYQKNIEKIRKKQKEYREKNKDYFNMKSKKWRENNQQHIQEYKKQNHDYIIKRTVNYQKQKRKNEPFLRFKDTTRNLINKSFRRKKFTKNGYTEKILGCNFKIFYNYLLQTFKNNYGYEWDEKEPVHIDHIIPLATAKTQEDVIKLCHYTNLQLLKAKDNLKKGKKLNYKITKGVNKDG